MNSFLKRNGLSISLLSLFLFTWVGQFFAGFHANNADLAVQGYPALSKAEYLHSAHFWEGTFENWESEFLQMAIYVVLTAFLFQQGSSESNPLPGEEQPKEKLKKRYFVGRPLLRRLYETSLSLALFLLFALSWIGHFCSGLREENLKRAMEGRSVPLTPREFITNSTFWFQSLQNWQSEFMSIGVIVLLSIFLRQKNSSQSKAVDAPHHRTGD